VFQKLLRETAGVPFNLHLLVFEDLHMVLSTPRVTSLSVAKLSLKEEIIIMVQ